MLERVSKRNTMRKKYYHLDSNRTELEYHSKMSFRMANDH